MTSPCLPDRGHLVAEFDLLADQYHAQHAANIAVTGEKPEYFAEYKVRDLAELVAGRRVESVLDFGSGIGNSIPFFRQYLPGAALHCADVSPRSIQVARERFPGAEQHVLVEGTIPLPDSSQDVVFSVCVFHHIPHEEHSHWLAELRRVTRPGGLLVVYEHNPLNPLTVHAVNTCPLDANARLIGAAQFKARAHDAGWEHARADYKVFFPAPLRRLRVLESRLQWLPLGAQYRLSARNTR